MTTKTISIEKGESVIIEIGGIPRAVIVSTRDFGESYEFTAAGISTKAEWMFQPWGSVGQTSGVAAATPAEAAAATIEAIEKTWGYKKVWKK
jgi:hypothetical protein